MSKKIVILANSRKLSGRCVAGKDEYGKWIRLTKNGHNPIPVNEAINFGMLKVLEVEGIISRPSRQFNYHSENANYTRATAINDLDIETVDKLSDHPENIFGTGKLVTEVEVQKLRESLLFVKVTNFTIYVKSGGQYPDKLRGQFTYNGTMYSDIAVTDSFVEARLSTCRSPYQETYEEAYITISLGEIFNGYAYKLISGVIIIP
jgi:hypothetical protein